MNRWPWWRWIGLVSALSACRAEPLGEPWCTCSAQLASGSVQLRVYPQPLEGGAPYLPQAVEVYVARGAQRTLELHTEMQNDGALLDPKNARLLLVAPGRYQLRLEGWKQSPACYRVIDPGTLQSEACATGTDVACHYRALRPDH